MCRRTMSTQVTFELPEHVGNVNESFDGADVSVTYDSNFGGSVTVESVAKIAPGRYAIDWSHLVVDGRYVRNNGHVFNADGRHLGTVESMTVTVDHDVAVSLVADGSDHDVGRNDAAGETVVQAWDRGVIDSEGFMAGTFSVRLSHVQGEN